MAEPAPRGPNLAFLVVSWVVLLVLGVGCAAFAILDRVWPPLQALLGLGFLWLAITGLTVRRLWPRSHLGRLFPETISGRRADEPARRPLLTILLVVAVALAVVAIALYR